MPSYDKDYYNKNKEKILEQHKAHHKRYKNHYLLYKRAWRKTLPGKLSTIINRIRRRCTVKEAHNYKYYGGRGIVCKLTIKDLLFLWNRDNAYKLKHPSVDRIDNDGPYARINCRFIEHSENIAKRWSDRKKSLGKRRGHVPEGQICP